MPVASILIEVDEKGAVSSFNRLGAAGAQLDAGLSKAGQRGGAALEGVTKSSERARQSAQLLANTMGIQLPRALEQVLSKTPGVSQALNAAFAATVIVTFAKEVLSLVDNLTGYSEQLGKIQAQNDALISSVAAANKTLLGPQTLKQVQADILATTKYIADLEKQLGLTGGAFDPLTRGLTRYNGQNRVLVEELDKAKARLNELNKDEADKTAQKARGDALDILKAQNQARLAGLEGIGAIRAAEIAADAETIKNAKDVGENDAVTQAKIAANHAESAAKIQAYEKSVNEQTRALASQALLSYVKGTDAIIGNAKHQTDELEIQLNKQLDDIANSREADAKQRDDSLQVIQTYNDRRTAIETIAENQIREIHRQGAEDTLKLEEDAALALVPPWQRSYAEIAKDTADRLREIQRALDETRISSEEAGQRAAAAWQVNFARTRDQLASDMESLFDDITSGNIGRRFKKMFEDLVFQMIATWLLGVNKMRAGTASAMGGGGAGLLSILLGGGGGSGGGPGGTPPFLGGLFGSSGSGGSGIEPFHSEALGQFSPFSGGATASGAIFGLGLSAGQGAGGPGGVLPSGSATGGAIAGLGGFLSKIFPHGIGGVSGSQLATMGIGLGISGILSRAQGGGALGVLEGAAGGALTGFAFGGPIGAVIGGAIGLVSSIVAGLFGEHKGDKARKQVMEPLVQQIKLIKDSYDVFQTDYNSGVSELEQLRSSSLATLKSIGGRQVGGNSKAVGVMVDSAEAYLKMTEAERARRGQLNFGPAQFHEGGVVRGGMAAIAGVPAFHMGGEVNANLLIGEGVVNQRGMSRLGEAGLKRINAGGPMGDRHLHVHTIDTKSFNEWLHDGGLRVIVDAWDDAEAHGGV